MIYPLVHGSWSLGLNLLLWLMNVIAVRLLVPQAFGSRRFFATVLGSFTVLLAAHGAWSAFHDHNALGLFAITVSSAAPVFLALTLLSIPVAAVLVAITRRAYDRIAKRNVEARSAEVEPVVAPVAASSNEASNEAPVAVAVAKPPIVSRRNVLALAATVAPAAALGVGIRGFSRGFSPVRVTSQVLTLPRLPASLEGLRVAQLSDVHLGVYRQLDDLARALEALAEDKPDMVVLTGDFVEHGNLLEDALRLVRDLGPRYGTYACLGNHEYFQAIRGVRDTYERAGVPLLVDASETVRIGDERVAILGVDDPRRMDGDIRGPLRASIERSLVRASGDTRLLLSHRPEAVVPASSLDVALVLSGHTHGGQIGFNGKSAFEPLTDEGYLWGAYLREKTRLYTTSGFGHWYPFRLGCESELPVLTLTRGGAAAPSAIARS